MVTTENRFPRSAENFTSPSRTVMARSTPLPIQSLRVKITYCECADAIGFDFILERWIARIEQVDPALAAGIVLDKNSYAGRMRGKGDARGRQFAGRLKHVEIAGVWC